MWDSDSPRGVVAISAIDMRASWVLARQHRFGQSYQNLPSTSRFKGRPILPSTWHMAGGRSSARCIEGNTGSAARAKSRPSDTSAHRAAFREIDQFRVNLHPGGLAVRPDVSDRLGPVHVVGVPARASLMTGS